MFWRCVLLGGFTALALALFLPSTPLSERLPLSWAAKIPKIVLGLDLQGGMHLTLDVDRVKAVENYTDRMSNSIEALLKEKSIPYISVRRNGVSSVSVRYEGEAEGAGITKAVNGEYPVFSGPQSLSSAGGGAELVFTLSESERKRVEDSATTQALETIRNRIDKFGVSEPLIQRQGEGEIVVQLPGMKDPQRAISLIGKTAILEFRLLDEEGDPLGAVSKGVPFGDELMYQKKTDPKTGRSAETPYLVRREVLLTGDLLSDARVAFDSQFNEPYVSLTFNSMGSRIFERITEANTGKRLAIILDGNIHSAPVIREKIAGGRAQISGGFAYDEANDLAIVLRAGALPAPVNIVQNVTIGPTLGKDSVRAGVKAAVLGWALVFVFMVVYYKFSGVIADFAMVLNLAMLLGVMAWLNSTLTMPGIAGIVLTVGMGVDANVLIFERIKEELKAGRTPRSAVEAGYDRAWWTIIDSHITTLITAAVLFQFGSGPIKGFAVSLSLGIIINLFTSLIGTKLAFDIQNERFRIKRLSI
ncbi:MAG: protein translocase subunit SecD [Deltaproteobacteria bacterium]|nr:protein translocase subunit SecD [Deltaproteobacteria bacterium]